MNKSHKIWVKLHIRIEMPQRWSVRITAMAFPSNWTQTIPAKCPDSITEQHFFNFSAVRIHIQILTILNSKDLKPMFCGKAIVQGQDIGIWTPIINLYYFRKVPNAYWWLFNRTHIQFNLAYYIHFIYINKRWSSNNRNWINQSEVCFVRFSG